MASTLALALLGAFVMTMFDTCNGSPLKFGSSTFNITIYPSYQCKSISFDSPFTGSVTDSDVRVQATLHEVGLTYEASVAWVTTVKLVGFTACVESSGPIIGSRIINLQYLAFVGVPTGGVSGLALVPLHTTGTKCVNVYPSGKVFTKVPHVYVTSVHTQAITNNQRDASSVWAEEVTTASFKICLRELKNFDGVHRHLRVDWLALEEIPSGWSRVQYRKQITFLNNLPPPEQHHYSFCQSVSFPNTFYTTPTLITTASHKTLGVLGIKPDNNAITEWVEEVNLKGFRVCMKDIQPFDGHHDPVTVNYLAVGYLHPCLSVTCPWYEVCNAYGPLEARCECDEPCPDYEAQLCGSDGLTYKNYCKYKLTVCLGKRSLKIAHNGSCIPFVLHRGRVALDLASTEVQCKTVSVKASTFQFSLAVRVETSINYFNNSDSSFVHDAAVSWAEEISLSSFQVCALKAGRNDRLTPDNGLTFVDYIAYQGAPEGTVTGETLINNWWEGTTCQTVKLPSGKFDSTPYVVVTAEHMVKDQKHDAATTWVEEATADSFKVCLRELQDFDGLHSKIYINWFAYNELPLGMATERHQLAFSNSGTPSAADNHAFCKLLTFDTVHSAPPTVLVSSRHTPGAGKLDASYNSIATWVESIGTSSCKVCLRELHSDSGVYDPLTVNTLVLDCKGKEPDGCRISTSLVDRSFDVEFPRIGTSDYVILRDVITTPLTAMSVCLWMKTSDTSSTGSLFSYSALANGGSDNEFLIINYKGFQMMVNGKDSPRNVSANDGKWHHICATWRSSDGSWAFYKDGVATIEGTGMKTGHKIVANGIVVLGQDQDVDSGGFQPHQSFKGVMSNINVWSRFVPAKEIKEMATSCILGTGDVMRWSDVKGHYKGILKETSPASCVSSV